jgi:DNA-binding transcriptional ArsR family regulator
MSEPSGAPFRLPAAPLSPALVSKYFRGLGDPIRLRILEALRSEANGP